MQSRKSTIILLISFFIGLSVLLYPSISSYWNSKTQSEAIVDYEVMLAAYKPEDYSEIFETADQYNAELRKFFDEMYNLFIDIKAKKLDNVSMDILSMGMSGDYEEAILCGSNLVRVGSAIFGPRIYK